jgi:hypothetical protein
MITTMSPAHHNLNNQQLKRFCCLGYDVLVNPAKQLILNTLEQQNSEVPVCLFQKASVFFGFAELPLILTGMSILWFCKFLPTDQMLQYCSNDEFRNLFL